MATHPDWATKHKKKGTELRLINGRYYLYEVSSKWDPQKKRAKKITGKLLGRITEDKGFIESDKAKLRKQAFLFTQISVKEYGIISFIDTHLSKYKSILKKYFPGQWKVILALAYGRLVYHSPMKNMEFHYQHSYLSEEYHNLKLSPKNLTSFLRVLGTQRTQITNLFQEFNKAKNNILFDGTDLISQSKKMDITKLSKSKRGTFDTLTNLMFAFSVELQLPIYYRILPGNIKDIKAFRLCLEEAQINDAVIIIDKGFYSDNNIEQLQEEGLSFIIPLKRNNHNIDYGKLNTLDKKGFDGFFRYRKRIIWYYSYKTDKRNINVYLDEALKTEEIKDYLNRTEAFPEKYDMKTFHRKQHTFGTISMMHNVDKDPEKVYVSYKSRGQVELMIDVFKNTLEADKSYMQNEQALEAWMFINFIALHWYYKIYRLLVEKQLTNKYSPMDFVLFLREIRKVKINGKWYEAEITNKTKSLLELLNIPIT